MNALLGRAIAILKAVPAVRFVVVLPDGTEFCHGDLQVVRTKRRKTTYPLGSLSSYYKPFLENLQVGEFVEIPFDHFDPEDLRSSICAHSCNVFGKGSIATAKNPAKNCIEVLRIN